MSKSGYTIDVMCRDETHGARVPAILEATTHFLDTLQAPSEAEISLLLTDDQEVQSLNREYRGVDRPTDVLSFSLQEGEGAGVFPEALGDIVVSMDRTLLQAEEKKWPLELELEFLILHGLLHLLGFDHGEAEQAREMESMTQLAWRARHADRVLTAGFLEY